VTGQDPGASAMTLLERDAWLHPDPAITDVTHGYPEGLAPRWMRRHQEHPPAGFASVPPGEYEDVIHGWFSRFLDASGVVLVPSCTMAFAITAQAVMQQPGDEIIVIDTSYDSYPRLLAALGATVAWARRDQDGNPDPDSVRAGCTERTRAVVIVCPDNPLGTVVSPAVMDRLLRLCQERGLTLIADHCLAPVNPLRAHIPLLPRLAARRPVSWAALGDTGKMLGLAGTKLGVIACPGTLRSRIDAAASSWFALLPSYDLAVIAAIVSDPRFAPYLLELSGRIGAAFVRLREEIQPPLTVALPDAGPFALIDAGGAGLDDVRFASLLRDRYRVLAVPLSWFPSGEPGPETRVRVSLARDSTTITRLIAALSACAADLAP
jgi:N-succinyldiaminopimelate aminotransferase